MGTGKRKERFLYPTTYNSIESGDKNWLTDGIFKTAVSETEIRHAADALLKYLEGAPDSCIRG